MQEDVRGEWTDKKCNCTKDTFFLMKAIQSDADIFSKYFKLNV